MFSLPAGHSYLKLTGADDVEDGKSKMKRRYFDTEDEAEKKTRNAKEVSLDL